MFTSAGPGEGKSTNLSNTAIALSQLGKKVLIIDCDLRKPTQHKIFGQKRIGITNILVENLNYQEVVQNTEIINLQLLAVGPIPPNPSELLSSERFVGLFEKIKQDPAYDYILVDAPPVLAVSDTTIIAPLVDGIIFVVNTQIVKPAIAVQSKEILEKAHAKILGVVLNKIEINKEYMKYYYYYSNDS